MSFLKAEWRKLAIANYEVDQSLLAEFLPAGTEFDTWNGINYLSLVGFMFENTKVLGVKIPLHTNFEEVNLRFYVRRKFQGEWRRGVVFIKEIVPRHAITLVANTLYGEHYATHEMKHSCLEHEQSITVSYEWKIKGQWQKFQVVADKQPRQMLAASEVEFITEHYWGYTKLTKHQTSEYEVTHPKWNHYRVQDHLIAVDFGLTYGNGFSFLGSMQPKSVMLAEGSEITVEGMSKLGV